MSTIQSTGTSAVDRRLAALRIRPVTAVAVVAALLVLVGDSQALALIPLLNTMSAEYELSSAEATLVLAILGVVAAGAVPVLTRVAERISMRGFLLLGVALTTVGNLLCALAPGFDLLLAGRTILGLSAAIPIAIALVRESSRGAHHVNSGLALVTASVGVSVAISFLLGGVILELDGNVHTVFWAMSALGAISLVVAWLLTPDFRVETKERADVVGAILLIVGLTALAITLSYGGEWGWGSATTLTFLLGGILVVALWVWWELRAQHPMIDLKRTFRRTTVPAYFFAGLFGTLAIVSNLAVTNFAEFPPTDELRAVPGLDYGFGNTVLQASMFLMPTAFFILVGGFAVGRIITRIGVKPSMFLAAVLAVAAFGFLALWHDEPWQNFLGMGIWGMAYALGYTTGNAAFVHVAKDGEGSLFSAASTTVTGTVGAMAAPLFTAVLYATVYVLEPPAVEEATSIPTAESYSNVWWVLAAGGVIVLLLAFLHRPSEYQGTTEDLPAVAARRTRRTAA